jgi:hypothetical protein
MFLTTMGRRATKLSIMEITGSINFGLFFLIVTCAVKYS